MVVASPRGEDRVLECVFGGCALAEQALRKTEQAGVGSDQQSEGGGVPSVLWRLWELRGCSHLYCDAI